MFEILGHLGNDEFAQYCLALAETHAYEASRASVIKEINTGNFSLQPVEGDKPCQGRRELTLDDVRDELVNSSWVRKLTLNPNLPRGVLPKQFRGLASAEFYKDAALKQITTGNFSLKPVIGNK